MKKLLALSLAVVMVLAISVTAFGWTASGIVSGEIASTGPVSGASGHLTPGDTLELDYEIFYNTTAAYFNQSASNYSNNDGKFDTFDDAITEGVKVGNYSISYTFSSPSKSAIDSVKFDADEGKVVITLKQNYTMSLNTLNGKIELKPKSTVSTGQRYTYEVKFGKTFATSVAGTHAVAASYVVATPYTLDTTYGYVTLKAAADDVDLIWNYDDLKKETTLGNGADFITNWASASGTAMISWGAFSATENSQYDDPDFYFEVKINSSGKMNLSYSTKVVKDIAQKYEEAELDFISFPAAPSFDYTGTAKFFTDDEKYVYEIKDGGLAAVNTTYDDDEGCYSWKTRTLGSYVISDVELDTTATSDSDSDGDTTNPDTGANDFVNVAVALAVVSLAAAGAVVLKKK